VCYAHRYVCIGFYHGGQIKITAGCHTFTLKEAREYWTGEEDRAEALAAINYIEEVAKLREWEVKKDADS